MLFCCGRKHSEKFKRRGCVTDQVFGKPLCLLLDMPHSALRHPSCKTFTYPPEITCAIVGLCHCQGSVGAEVEAVHGNNLNTSEQISATTSLGHPQASAIACGSHDLT
jgi:hypothetical protein